MFISELLTILTFTHNTELLTILTDVSIVASLAHTDEGIDVDVNAGATIVTGGTHTGHPRF